jgi:hypothetical protein
VCFINDPPNPEWAVVAGYLKIFVAAYVLVLCTIEIEQIIVFTGFIMIL